MSKALDAVVELLDLEQIELDIFRGRSPENERRQRVFGGQVAGQALVAAGRTVPDDRPVHSLHAYFIRPGDPAVPLIYLVDRVRDGRSFTTRRVSAVQHGKTIFTLSASFHHPEEGVLHQRPMPDVPPPESVPSAAERMEALFGEAAAEYSASSPIDIRHLGPLSFEAVSDPALRVTHSMAWVRADGDLPDDPLLHVCILTYASDMTLLDSVLLGHGLTWLDGPEPPLALLRELGAEYWNPWFGLLTSEGVAAVHEDGRRVSTWTVDTPEDMTSVLGSGVDAVVSNRIAALVAHLGR